MSKNNNILDRLVTKITSARWLVCVLLTITFVYITCIGRVSTEFLSVYTLVVGFYFARNDRNKA